MKTLSKIFFATIFVFYTGGCTSNSEIESLSIDSAKAKMKSKFLLEADQAIKGKANMKSIYATVILGHSEFEIENSNISESSARVIVKVKTVPLSVREKLMGVVEKLDEWKDSRFNMSDALGLVKKQLNNQDTATENILIELRKSGDWQLVQ